MADVCFMSDEDDFIVDDDDEVENYDAEDSYDNAFGAPNKVAIAKTKKSKNILKESTNKVSTSTVKASKANSPKEKRQKAVEETYQKLTPHEVSLQLTLSWFMNRTMPGTGNTLLLSTDKQKLINWNFFH